MALKVTEMAGGVERLEQRSKGQSQERDRRDEGPLSSGLISNPVSASKAPAYVGEGSGKAVTGEPRSAYEARFTEETGPEEGSFVTPQQSWRGLEEWNNPLTRRLKIPMFDGEDADSWVIRTDQYFEIGDFTEEDKLKAVRVCFAGEALSWYRWERHQNPFLSWEEMKSRVLKQFSVSRDSSDEERLLKTTEGGEGKVGRASNGRFQAPATRPNTQGSNGSYLNNPKSTTGTTTLQNNGEQKPHNRVKPPFRHLTLAEIAQQKAEGLCFRCDEKYRYNHHCPKPELMVIMVMEDGTEIDVPDCSVEVEEALAAEEVEVAEISISSMMGISSSRTIKLMGTIRGAEVVVLIDSGATHNFVSTEFVRKMELETDDMKGYSVLTAGGVTIRGTGRCKPLELTLQGCKITSTFLPLELGSVDVILGIQWLETLGNMKVNWKWQILRFKVEGKKYLLQGDPRLCCSQISAKTLRKTMEVEGEAMLIEYYGMQLEERPLQGSLATRLTPVLEAYSQVFEEPKELPPSRGKEHAIVLRTDAQPVSVRPFRYPQAQKEDIEKQVANILAAVIIRESSSPFSSPVLLVKKKDGSWRFCIDYRALNKVTIADCYPIPMIDQLLDELQGAVIFSKLDLKSGYHQILVKACNVPKTAIRTHDGHYEFLVLPFRMSNAPATFQSLMIDIFRGYLRKFVLVFFDDILVYSKTPQEHMEHVRIVLDILQQHKLYANKKKCQFGTESIEYLGHVVTAKRVAADEGKMQAMKESKEPRNVKELRGFLGLTGYYRKFVQGYGDIARPMTSLLKKKQSSSHAEPEALGLFQPSINRKAEDEVSLRAGVDGNSICDPKVASLPYREEIFGPHGSEEPEVLAQAEGDQCGLSEVVNKTTGL
ncbi:PREDICTED: uncharacterized protein LOC106321225 [Brassica oleracea var. oleracea]|uniref:uncharacterized protein LOC106321225 n=1 Tax=Brassica oleracea var. oleracea TaxID=109376 RepID=UPI0006A73D99|nr:PREDICTED: uncharacterized protein LOC106321225 [Brassica oleracea var. oleracea]